MNVSIEPFLYISELEIHGNGVDTENSRNKQDNN